MGPDLGYVLKEIVIHVLYGNVILPSSEAIQDSEEAEERNRRDYAWLVQVLDKRSLQLP